MNNGDKFKNISLGLLSILSIGILYKYYTQTKLAKLKNKIFKLRINKLLEANEKQEFHNVNVLQFSQRDKIEMVLENTVKEVNNKIPQIYKICLTGGPCAGKTSGLEYLAEKFRERGFNVYIIPEAATMMYKGGGMLNMGGYTEDDVQMFQMNLMRLQMSLENTFQTIALIGKGPSIMICDRGLMDGKAYMSQECWKDMLEQYELEEVDIRDKRYQCVIHLITAADGAEKFYQQDNDARHESFQQAIEQDRRTQAAWVGHPNYFRIDNYSVNTFQEKLHQLFIKVAKVVGMSVDQQKRKRMYKIQLQNDRLEIGEDIMYQTFQLEVTYLKQTNNNTFTKLQKRTINGLSMFTWKQKFIENSEENQDKQKVRCFTRQILRKAYNQHLEEDRDQDRVTITKTRTCFSFAGQYMIIDVINTAVANLSLLTVKDYNPNKEIEFPTFITVEKELKSQEYYKARNLSKASWTQCSEEESISFRKISASILSEQHP